MPKFYQNDFLQRMNMGRLCGWRREALAWAAKGNVYAGNGKWAGAANDDVWSTIQVQQWR